MWWKRGYIHAFSVSRGGVATLLWWAHLWGMSTKGRPAVSAEGRTLCRWSIPLIPMEQSVCTASKMRAVWVQMCVKCFSMVLQLVYMGRMQFPSTNTHTYVSLKHICQGVKMHLHGLTSWICPRGTCRLDRQLFDHMFPEDHGHVANSCSSMFMWCNGGQVRPESCK